MPANNWYDPSQHRRFPAVKDLNEVNPLDTVSIYEACLQRERETAVKEAHLNFIGDKVRRCYMFHGVNNFKVHCRFLIEEYRQTRDELLGWREDKRVTFSVVFQDSSLCSMASNYHEPINTLNHPSNNDFPQYILHRCQCVYFIEGSPFGLEFALPSDSSPTLRFFFLQLHSVAFHERSQKKDGYYL
jgi:hypothetical protein